MNAERRGSIVILTGAGASKPFGYPTTIEFFSGADAVPDRFQEIYNSLRKRLRNRQPVDVEDLLRILQPADDFLATDSGRFLATALGKNWASLVPEFARHVRERCFELYGRHPETDAVLKAYLPILELCGWEQFSIDLFTTNYDPVTDQLLEAASDQGLRAYGGFDQFAKWDPEQYDWSEPGLKVFRLHGSMSWVRDGSRITNTHDYTLRRGTMQRHLIVFPGFKGDPEHDEMDETFQFVHHRLRSALKSATACLAIGYSFRDEAINRAFDQALQANSVLRVIVLNPEFPEGEDGWLIKTHQDNPNVVRHIEDRFGEEGVISQLRGAIGAGVG